MARNISFSTPAVQYGLIAGLVYSFGLAILYLLGDYYLVGTVGWVFSYRLIPYVVVVAIGIYAGVVQKKLQGGYIPFVQALLTILLALLIAEAFYIFTMWLLYNVIDPELSIRAKDIIISQMEERFLSLGISGKEVDEAIAIMEREEMGFGLKEFLLTAVYSIVLSIVIALISAAIIKKEKPYQYTNEASPTDAN